MKVLGRSVFVFNLYILFAFFCFSGFLEAQENWSIAAYSAVLSRAAIEDCLFNASQIDDSFKLIALALGRRIKSIRHIDFELEGQAVKHFGNQDHMEFNAVFIVRWLTFPWNNYINTSLAVGDGLSYAAKTPQFERLLHHDRVSQLLNYLLFELSLSMPNAPRWHFIARLHHRSGINGVFNGVDGGSNALGLGIKYKF